ncbi:MAG: cupin domain-containing protein, partial [Holdemania filiformis]
MKTQVELNADASEKIRYNDPAYPIYHCPGRLSDYPNYTALNHWHEDLEFIVVHSGSMSYNVSGEILTLNSGEGLIVNARQMHYGFSPDRTECTFLCLLLHPQLLCPLPSFKRNLIDPLIENTAAPFVFLRPEIPWQKEIRDHILAIEAGADTHSAPLQALSR